MVVLVCGVITDFACSGRPSGGSPVLLESDRPSVGLQRSARQHIKLPALWTMLIEREQVSRIVKMRGGQSSPDYAEDGATCCIPPGRGTRGFPGKNDLHLEDKRAGTPDRARQADRKECLTLLIMAPVREPGETPAMGRTPSPLQEETASRRGSSPVDRRPAPRPWARRAASPPTWHPRP